MCVCTGGDEVCTGGDDCLEAKSLAVGLTSIINSHLPFPTKWAVWSSWKGSLCSCWGVWSSVTPRDPSSSASRPWTWASSRPWSGVYSRSPTPQTMSVPSTGMIWKTSPNRKLVGVSLTVAYLCSQFQHS